MEGIKIYSSRDVEKLIFKRKGEFKFGEKVNFVENLDELSGHKSRYVLFGIPEDIGVRANSGNAGTANAWKVCISSLLNVQANKYTNPESVILLGEVNCNEVIAKAGNLGQEDPNYLAKLGDLVALLDRVVSRLVLKIISAGKIPIIIGGGHNNAFGNLKGASNALHKPINCLNIDAHTDFRNVEHRHSGNGFRHAREGNFLGKYRIFGVHQNYTPSYIFEELDASANDQYRLFEHLILKSSREILQAYKEELDFISHDEFGLELDCDSIRDFPSSAQTPSGFSFNMVRNFIAIASEQEKIKYLHICEAAPSESTEARVGKALSYLITDFIQPAL